MSNSCCTNNSLDDSNLTINPYSINHINKHKLPKTTSALRVISVNCRSLRSLSRQARLCGLIHEHKPDIIVGCESHLDNSYNSSEIFPVGFNIYRKDRTAGGGGVFLGIKDVLVTMEEPTLDTSAELIWAKINVV